MTNSSLILHAITPHRSINWKISFLNPPSWRFAQNVWAWGRLGALLMSSFCRRKWGPEGLYEPHWASHLLMAELLPLTPTLGLLLLPWCLSEGTIPPPTPTPCSWLKIHGFSYRKEQELDKLAPPGGWTGDMTAEQAHDQCLPSTVLCWAWEDKRSVHWKEDGHMLIEDGPAV